jgi:hypothetical protein
MRILFLLFILISSLSCRKFVWDNPNDSINAGKEPASLTEGLVAYFPFNGNANDESGNGNNGIVKGAVLTSDRFGKLNKAYGFDGASIITVNQPSFAFQESQDFAVSCFAYLTAQSYSDVFVGYGDISSGNYVWYLGQYINRIQWGVALQQSFWSVIALPDQVVMPEDNKWYHVLGVKKDRILTLYINGKVVGTVNQVMQGAITKNLPLTIGGFTQTLQFNNGKLDDIRIYNRALTQEEITYLANN